MEENEENLEKQEIEVEEQTTQSEDKNNEVEDKKEEKKKINWGNILSHFVAVICVILFSISITPKTLQNDTFYTIPIGEYIFNNGISDLTKDLYSWHNIPYTYPHWLYDLSMFLIYNSFGQTGIYVSTMVFAAALGVAVYNLCFYGSKNKIISGVVTIGAMYLIRDFIAARAQLVTFVLFTWTVYNIEKFLDTENKRNEIMLILIPLLITNLHCAVFPFYFVLFMPYIGEYFLVTLVNWDLDLKLVSLFWKFRRKLSKKEEKVANCETKVEKVKYLRSERIRKRKILRENPYKVKVRENKIVMLLIPIIIIAAVTGFLNPAGTGAYTYLYRIMQGNTTSSINEHLPTTLADNTEFTIAIVIFLAILIFTDTKIRLSDLFMLGGLTFLSFMSRRQVSMFGLFCAPILARMISQMVEKYDKETFMKLEKFISEAFGAFVVVCLCFIWSTNLIKPHLRADYIDASSYPVDASEWMLENLDVKNIKLYNEYNYGSYLLFKGIPVFIDSRCDLYTPEFNGDKENGVDGKDIFSDALNIAGLAVDYKTKFKEYGVTHIILYENSKLAMILKSDSNYKELYREGNFVIFERLDVTSNG